MNSPFAEVMKLSTTPTGCNPGLFIGIIVELVNIPVAVLYRGRCYAREVGNAAIVSLEETASRKEPSRRRITYELRYLAISWESTVFADSQGENFLAEARKIIENLGRGNAEKLASSLRHFIRNAISADSANQKMAWEADKSIRKFQMKFTKEAKIIEVWRKQNFTFAETPQESNSSALVVDEAAMETSV